MSAWGFPPQAMATSTSAYDFHTRPGWHEQVEARLAQLLNLKPGWDGHRGSPVDPDTVQFATDVLGAIMHHSTPAPQIVPLSFGGLQLEWHVKGIDLEIEITRPGAAFAIYEDVNHPGAEFESSLSTDFRMLKQPIIRLTM